MAQRKQVQGPTSTTSSPSVSTSRRGFLKTSAVAAGGAAIAASGLNIARAAHAAGNDEIKFALIGCGGRGTGAATQALNTSDQGPVKLIAMADAFADNLERCRNTLKRSHADSVDVPEDRRFVGFDAYKKALEAGIDLVVIATPPGFRPIHFAEAIAQNKHVFMEKPVGVDGPGIRKVLETAKVAKEKGLAVGVGLQRHHQTHYIETIKRLQDGAIGDILLTRVYWNGAGVWTRPRRPGQTEMEYQMRNWYYFNWLCGDHIVEQHIHNLDVSNWLKDAHPVSANGMGGREVRTGKEHGQIFDHHFVEFTYADGTTMMSQCRHIPDCWSQVDEFCTGTYGTSHIGDGIISVHGWEPWRAPRGRDPYQQEHDDLFAAIRRGEPYSEAEYGANSTMTAILGRMATYSGKVITWDEAINSKKDLSPQEYSFDATPPVVPDDQGNYPVPVPGKYDPLA